jgi:hypothetical protein
LKTSQTWLGFDSRPLVTGGMALLARPGTVLLYSDLLQSLAARVRAVDGVAEAAASTQMQAEHHTLAVEDPGGIREYQNPYGVDVVSPSYLRTLQRPIVRGRDFLDGERDAGVVIVDEQTARTLWPNANPIGAQMKFGDAASSRPWVRVVGVVGEQPGFYSDPVPGARMFGAHRLGATFYVPGPADSLVTGKYPVRTSFIARARSKPQLLPIAILQASTGWPDVAARGVASIDEALGLTRDRQNSRFISSLFMLFAAMGVGLAAFGVYGVVAHSVAERRRELGVRIALGATARDILHAVLRESVVVALCGVALGLLITKYSVKHLDSIVLEDDIFNAPVFATVALVLVLTAAAAALVPALRATRVDPTESLRNE